MTNDRQPGWYRGHVVSASMSKTVNNAKNNLTSAQIKIDAHEASRQALQCSATRHWCINIAAQIFTFSEHSWFTILSSGPYGPSSVTCWCQTSSHPQSQRILLFLFHSQCHVLHVNSLTFSSSFLLKAKKPNYTFSKYICSIPSMTEPKIEIHLLLLPF